MNANPLVLDIETVALSSALLAPYPEDRQPPSNWKDPEKIAAWHLADEAKWREGRVKECSLNPRLGRVLALGVTTEDNTDVAVTFAKTEADEPALLRAFWETIGMEGGEVVTWNGGFDLRFLVTRSMFHGITPSVRSEVVRSWFKKYASYPHFDCRGVLNNWQDYAEGEGLAEWAAFFKLPERPESIRHLSGADVYRLYQANDWATLELYCGWDVKDTKLIYERISGMFATPQALRRIA